MVVLHVDGWKHQFSVKDTHKGVTLNERAALEGDLHEIFPY